MPINEAVRQKARSISEATGQDIYILSGELGRPLDIEFIRLIESSKTQANAFLILVTPGGDADVAYRIARAFQEAYDKVSVFVSGWCKSAGTLCAIGAHRLIMSQEGELGPLDVQLGRKDDLFDYESGLDIDAAIQALKGYVSDQFESLMLQLITRSDGRISVALASQVSSTVAVGLFSEIYSQIDPIKMGEVSRSMTIAKDYGKRLAAHSDNLLALDGIDLLVSSYCSHSFVIDFLEAKNIFKNIERPDSDILSLHKLLGDTAIYPMRRPLMICLSNNNTKDHHDETDDTQEKPDADAETGNDNTSTEGSGTPSGDSAGSTGESEDSSRQTSDGEQQGA